MGNNFQKKLQLNASLKEILALHNPTISNEQEGMWNLENGEFLPLFLYGEGCVRVVDDGGAGGLRV